MSLTIPTDPSSKSVPNYYADYLTAADKAADKLSLQGCYDYLISAINDKLGGDDLKQLDIEQLFDVLDRFQSTVLAEKEHKKLCDWFFSGGTGLLSKLLNHLKKDKSTHLSDLLLQLLWAGIDLSLIGCEGLSSILITEKCPNLTNLNFYRCKQLSDEALITVAKHCPHLTELDLSGYSKLTNRAIIAIAKHCPNLSRLVLAGCRQLSGEALIAVGEHCTNLTNLNLFGCVRLSKKAKNLARKNIPHVR